MRINLYYEIVRNKCFNNTWLFLLGRLLHSLLGVCTNLGVCVFGGAENDVGGKEFSYALVEAGIELDLRGDGEVQLFLIDNQVSCLYKFRYIMY